MHYNTRACARASRVCRAKVVARQSAMELMCGMPRKPRDRYPQDDSQSMSHSADRVLEVQPVKLTKPVMGRARKELTSEKIDIFCRALDMPLTFKDAAGAVGFSERTLRGWIAQGEDEDCQDELLVELAHKVGQVMAGGHRAALNKLLLEHAVFDPKAALAALNIFSPSTQITKNVKVEATVAPKGPALDYGALDDAELEEFNRLQTKLALAAQNKL